MTLAQSLQLPLGIFLCLAARLRRSVSATRMRQRRQTSCCLPRTLSTEGLLEHDYVSLDIFLGLHIHALNASVIS